MESWKLEVLRLLFLSAVSWWDPSAWGPRVWHIHGGQQHTCPDPRHSASIWFLGSGVEAFRGLPLTGWAQLAKSVKYLSGKRSKSSELGPHPSWMLRGGFRFPAAFPDASSTAPIFWASPPLFWPPLCAFLLCFSSFDHIVWVRGSAASFECWENIQSSATRNALAFQFQPPLGWHDGPRPNTQS